MVHTVDGYDIAYSRRGSWKADRSFRGEVLDQVPVAWDRDYQPGKPPFLTIWFQGLNEAADRLAAGIPFIAALATKKPDGAAARDINRLLKVSPIKIAAEFYEKRSGLLCEVVGKCDLPSRKS